MVLREIARLVILVFCTACVCRHYQLHRTEAIRDRLLAGHQPSSFEFGVHERDDGLPQYQVDPCSLRRIPPIRCNSRSRWFDIAG